MKNLILLACLILPMLLMSNCKKVNVEVSNSIIGSWELRELKGGYRSPNAPTNYSAGNGNIWTLEDSTYEYYFANQLIGKGKYSLGKDTAPANGRYMDFLVIDQQDYNKIFFEIKNDVLIFYRGKIAFDGTIEKYQRR